MSLGDYTAGGQIIECDDGKVSTLGFDYEQGGQVTEWLIDGTSAEAADNVVQMII